MEKYRKTDNFISSEKNDHGEKEIELINSAMSSTVFNYSEIFEIDLVSGKYQMLYPEFGREDYAGDYYEVVRQRVEVAKLTDNDKNVLLNFLSADNIRHNLKPNSLLECKYKKTDEFGVEEWCLIGLTAGKFEDGVIVKAFLTIRSIEDILADEQVKMEVLNDLLTKNKIMGETRKMFFENMSHDMRTPLNTIIGNANLAKINLNNPLRLEKYLNRIIEAGSILTNLVEEVMEVTKIQTNAEFEYKDLCDFTDIFTEIKEPLINEIHDKKLSVSIENNLTHDKFYCDKSRFKQMMFPVLCNAVRYNKEEGRVVITLDEMKSTIPDCSRFIITIEDTGFGMKEDFVGVCMEPYQRENNFNSSGVRGVGLGLFMMKKLCDAFNGSVKIESEKNVGTKVKLSFNFNYATDVKKEVKASDFNFNIRALAEEKRSVFEGKKFLLVEDDETNAHVISEYIKLLGGELVWTSEGYEAVKRINENGSNEFSAVFMDINLPGMNGYETAKMIRAMSRNEKYIPIIAITANASGETELKVYKNNMNGYVEKPINFKKFVSIITQNLT